MSIRIITGDEKPINSKRIGIVVSKFHEDVTLMLLENSLEELKSQNISEDNIVIVKVSGSFEIPFALRLLLRHGEVDGVITLGCLIKGETTHYDVIASTSAVAIQRASEDFDLPVTYGVLTCLTKEQAKKRANGDVGNMGKEAAKALLQLLTIKEQVSKKLFIKMTTLEQ